MARRRAPREDDDGEDGPDDRTGDEAPDLDGGAPADAAGPGTDHRPSGHPAVYASNWRTVLVVDAAMGVAVAIAGIVLAVVWNVVAGGLLGSCGVAYVVAVVRRGRQWAELRRQAGL